MMREQEQTKIQLSVVQVVAGALASISAALVASTFGLKGTLLGAAVTSIVASVGGALYTHSLHRARARIQTRFNPHTGRIEQVVIPPQRVRRPIRWGMVTGVAGLVFLLAMGAITAVEVAARKPVAALVGSTSPRHGGTTVGTLIESAPGAAPIALPTIPMSATPGGTATTTPNGTPQPSPAPGGVSAVGTPNQAPAITATGVHPTAATPTAPARTPAPAQPTAAKPASTTPTAPTAPPPASTAATGTPHGAASP